MTESDGNFIHRPSLINHVTSPRPPKILESPMDSKSLISGGAADKGGILKVGDELVSVNAVDVTGMARIEAWNFLKKLPDGTVTLVLRQKLDSSSAKNEE
ncbi:PDZ domain-containing protein 2 [Portunus trituberculatus]|uniref:PDZ domain-containing protein 2 n=1 Tax=Portunus trituberculatus TaxID=210409 RepID=A0A5B7EPL5_PORTR|nr:PDZ domain-containing protein 2 [Portunus trituberculatus]